MDIYFIKVGFIRYSDKYLKKTGKFITEYDKNSQILRVFKKKFFFKGEEVMRVSSTSIDLIDDSYLDLAIEIAKLFEEYSQSRVGICRLKQLNF